MTVPRKGQGEDTAMGKLKALCRQNAAIRDELFKLSDELKSAPWRAEVKKRFGIYLSADSQLTRWRRWVFDIMDQELLNDQMELQEEKFRNANPGATDDEVRQAGIRYFMEQARARGDAKIFLDVFDRDLAERSARTRAKFKERELTLGEQRFQWDAAEACLKELPFIKKVATDTTLSQTDRIEAIRKRLWGTAPTTA